MARKMRKFSAGGAQGKYDRRMADIKKDFEKDSAGKSGKALEVLSAKRAQRTADAEDDRAKRMGTDRTATRKAEYDAEKNLSRTRRFGADKPVAAAAPVKASTPEPAKASEPAKDKPKTFGETFKAERARLGAGKTFTYNGKSYTTNIAGEGRKPTQRTATADASKADAPKVNYRNINFGKPSTSGAATGTPALIARNASSDAQAAKVAQPKDAPKAKPQETAAQATARVAAERARVAKLTGGPKRLEKLGDVLGIGSIDKAKARASLLAFREKEKARNAERGKGNSPLISGTDTRAFVTYGDAAAKKIADRKAKGGKVKKEKTMKYAKGGSTPPQPTPADRARSKKQLDELKKLKPTDKEGKVVGSANRSEGPGMAKGGKMASCGMKKGGKATKFGAAMKKKSADTKGRAMMKFAKGGSIDGCAVKGKTKAKMVAMKNGGSC
jgi:hypothetical protein